MGKAQAPPPVVRTGQVWEDKDPRNAGRTLRVESVHAGEGKAVCVVLTNARAGTYRSPVGSRVRIALKRFVPRRNGYALISEPKVIGLSAEEQAERFVECFTILPPHVSEKAHTVLVALFKEHARDQRHLCAASVPGFGDAYTVDPNPLSAHEQALLSAHAAVLNAPEPGNNP
jgi:hypothetical protein